MYQLAQASTCIALKKALELLYLVSAIMLQVSFARELGHQFPLKLIQQIQVKLLIFPNYDLQYDLS